MKIQTRLFLGTAVLVLALMGLQWWLYARGLRSIEEDLTGVAKTVGEGILASRAFVFNSTEATAAGEGLWITGENVATSGQAAAVVGGDPGSHEVQVMVVPEQPPVADDGDHVEMRVQSESVVSEDLEVSEEFEWRYEARQRTADEDAGVGARAGRAPADSREPQRVFVKVEKGDTVYERYLVVARDDRRLQRIPIPVSPTVLRVRETMNTSIALGGGLLVVGLLASAVMARRVSSPLRDLTVGADAVGSGELGVQVPVSAGGEIGELQRAFNHMSRRLAELESEREQWQQREHLAQLGDLSRGLAHTLRNPLHTLGLAVEELAGGAGHRSDLVATSRDQIRRIDRWLRSFLALGAGDSALPEVLDLRRLVESVVLESAQQGAAVELGGDSGPVPIRGVDAALRAAVANLVENAAQASPERPAVTVTLGSTARDAVLEIADRGPGLPAEVRDRLFRPHITTKVGGSGMGLFLARQLVVSMHGGKLEISDRDGGGTVVTVRLPLALDGASAEGSERA